MDSKELTHIKLIEQKSQLSEKASRAHTRIKQHLVRMEALLAQSDLGAAGLDELYYLAVDSRQLQYDITAYVNFCRTLVIVEGKLTGEVKNEV